MTSITPTRPDHYWTQSNLHHPETMSTTTSSSSRRDSASHFRDIRSTSTVTTSTSTTRSDSPGSSASSQDHTSHKRYSRRFQLSSPNVDEFHPKTHSALLEISRNPPRPLPRCGVVNFRKEGDHLCWSPKVAHNTAGIAARVGKFEDAFLLEEFSSRALPTVKKQHDFDDLQSDDVAPWNANSNLHDIRIQTPSTRSLSKSTQESQPSSIRPIRSKRSKQKSTKQKEKISMSSATNAPVSTSKQTSSRRNLLRQPFGQPELLDDEDDFTLGRNVHSHYRGSNHKEQKLSSVWGLITGGHGKEGYSIRRRSQPRGEDRPLDPPPSRFGFGHSNEPRSVRNRDQRRSSNEYHGEQRQKAYQPVRYLSMGTVEEGTRQGQGFTLKRFSKYRSKRLHRHEDVNPLQDRDFNEMDSVPVSRLASRDDFRRMPRFGEPSSLPFKRGITRSISQRRRVTGVNALFERSAEIEKMPDIDTDIGEVEKVEPEIKPQFEDRPRDGGGPGRLSDSSRGREYFEKRGRVLSALGMNRRKSRSDLIEDDDDELYDDPYITFLTSEV